QLDIAHTPLYRNLISISCTFPFAQRTLLPEPLSLSCLPPLSLQKRRGSEMTIAGFLPLSAKPVLDEARRLCPERSFQGAVCSMEGTIAHEAAAAAQQAMNKGPSTESSIPAPLRVSCDNGSAPSSTRLAFVYGTLKRGFGNHWLMEELMAGSHAHFLGYALTKRRFPLVCGPFQVPFLLHSPSPSGHHVRGELYQVDSLAISRLDELEGVGKGHYERCPIYVRIISPLLDADTHPRNGVAETDMETNQNDVDQSNGAMDDAASCCTLAGPLSSCRMYMEPPEPDEIDSMSSSNEVSGYMPAEAYFACADYGLRMADRAPHIPCYTEKEALTYVRRKDRPHNRTFLEHVLAWIEKQGLTYS
ncbi:hypothetical protein GOP47_0021260, partial [Adiantum capillus-veneris]